MAKAAMDFYGRGGNRLTGDKKNDLQKKFNGDSPFVEVDLPGSEPPYSFQLKKIDHSEIEKKTVVSALGNERMQEALDENSLSDILLTMKSSGQIMGGIGYQTEDGKVEVLDGSRRRMACLLSGQPFKIYVTEKTLSKPQIDFLQSIFDAQKQVSMYEKAVAMAARFESAKSENAKTTQKEFALIESDRLQQPVTERTVSSYLSMASLPKDWVMLFPDMSLISHRLTTEMLKIRKQLSSVDGAHELFDEGLDSIATDLSHHANDTQVWLEHFRPNLKKLAKDVLESEKPKSDRVKPEVWFKSGKDRFFKVKRSGNRKVVFEASRIPADVMGEIEGFIKEKLGSLSESK